MAAAAVAVSACGLGPGSQEGTVELLVTRDYGNEVLVDREIGDLTESETAMRVLDDSAEIETRYGGGFVQSVEGLEGGNEDGRTLDWFFAVNGIVAELGSADFSVTAGDKVWWDYRDWTDAMDVGAVVGAYPAPMATGYGDADWPVRIECLSDRAACEVARKQLDKVGVTAEIAYEAGSRSDDTLRFVVGTWNDIKGDEDAARLEKSPSSSGVFARFESGEGPGGTDDLIGLDQEAETAREFGPDAGLVAASRRGDGPPVWFLTGGSDTGVMAAAAALTPEDLEHRYAAAVFDGRITSLPIR
ncbi:MAG TPA: DUF4430 domain-containing protein [Solirubrobacterales bacterium]|nr:DUF4430 domain-containing protein [Solirubrobacterales bacterium]